MADQNIEIKVNDVLENFFKATATWAMLVPVKDPTLTIYGTSMTFKKSDDGKSGFGFPNQSSPYSGLASRYQVPTASPYSFLDGNTLYNSLDAISGVIVYAELPASPCG